MNIEEMTEALYLSVENFLAKRLREYDAKLTSLETLLKAQQDSAAAATKDTSETIANAVKAALFDFRGEVQVLLESAASAKTTITEALAALPSRDDLIARASASAQEAVAAIPTPEPIDVTRLESSMKEYCSLMVREQVEALPKPKDGMPGKDGTSITVAQVVDAIAPTMEALVASQVRDAVDALPKPKDGAPGKDAEPVHPGVIVSQVEKAVAAAVAAIPKPEVDYKAIIEPLQDFIKGAVADEVAIQPKPKDGENGKDGTSVDPATVAKMVEDAVKAIEIVVPDPIPGKDGTSVDPEQVKEMVSAEVARQVLALPVRKEVDFPAVQVLVEVAVKHAVATMPPAAAGKDGFSPEDLSLSLDEDERTVVVTLSAVGREPVVKRVKLPVAINRGTYEANRDYDKGDIAIFDGSSWIAKTTTRDVPGTSKAWQLLAQRGRNGRDREVPAPVKEEPVRLK